MKTAKITPYLVTPTLAAFILILIAMPAMAYDTFDNPSFESALSPWIKHPDTAGIPGGVELGGAYHGSYQCYLGWSSGTACYIQQDIHTADITNFTVWYKVNPAEVHGSTLQIQNMWQSQSNTYLGANTYTTATVDNQWHMYTITIPAYATNRWVRYSIGWQQQNGQNGDKIHIDGFSVNGIPLAPLVSNVTLKLHEYQGSYETSPYINGTYYFNGQPYNCNGTGTTHTIDNGNYSNITVISAGYDTVQISRDIQADQTIELYLLKQNYQPVNYECIDSITHALIETPTIEVYDPVAGTRETTTQNHGSFSVITGHTIWINASKTGYGNFNQTYTIDTATQIGIVLPSTATAPEGRAYVTFKAWTPAYRPLEGVAIQIDGKVAVTDKSGLATILVNDSTTYEYVGNHPNYYPKTGMVTTSGNEFVDLVLQSRALPTQTPGTIGGVSTGWVADYKAAIDGVYNGIREAFNDALSPIYDVFDSIADSINDMVGRTAGQQSFLEGYATLFDLIGDAVAIIPAKVKMVITYYLLCLLALMVLNR